MKKIRLSLITFFLSVLFLPICGQNESINEIMDSVLINDSLAAYYGQIGNLEKAQEYAAKNMGINSLIGENSVPYAIATLKYVNYLYPSERDNDKELTNKGLKILKDSLGLKSSTYMKYLLEYAWRQYNYEQIQEAANIVQEVAEANYDGDEFYLGYLYYSYGHFLKDAGELEEAKKYIQKAELFFYGNKKLADEYYVLTLRDLAYLSFPDLDKAINILNKAKDITEQYKGKDCIAYLDVILDLSYVLRANQQLDTVLEYAHEAKNIGEKIKDIDYSSYLYTIEFLSNSYSDSKQYNEAIAYAEECLNLMKERRDFPIELRLPTLDSLVVYNWNISNIEKANMYAKEAYLIRKGLSISGEEMVRNLFYLLHSNNYLRKYEECESNVNEIRTIYGDAYSSSYKHYYDDMSVLKNSYFNRKMYKESLEVSRELYSTYMQQYGNDSEYLAELLKDQAYIYSYIGDIKNYHDISIKAMEMKKRVLGEGSCKYISDLSSEAYHFYNMGFIDESYNMYKMAANSAKQRYGNMFYLFVQNYLSAIFLWDRNKGELFDDYQIDELYSFLLFQRLLYGINNLKKETFVVVDAYYEYLNAGLSNLLLKYKNNPAAYNSLYNCVLLQKAKIYNKDDLKKQIQIEIGQDNKKIFDSFCHTIDNYLKAQTNSEPNIVDSLYKKINQYIDTISNKSISFNSFCKGLITVEDIKTNMLDNEVIIDYLSQKQFGNSLIDYLVVLDKEMKYPEFLPVTNTSNQIKQISNSYTTTYLLINNDSILSDLKIDKTKSNIIIGYDMSVGHIMNRGKNVAGVLSEPIPQKETNNHLDYFMASYKEFERGLSLYKKKQYTDAICFFYQCDSLMYLAKGETSNYFGHGMHWISSCYHKLGLDSIAKNYSQYYYLQPVDMRQTIVSDSILDIAARLYDDGNKNEALKKYLETSKYEKNKLGKSYWYANTISRCAEICNELGEYEKAIELEQEAIDIRKKSPGINHIDYYWSLKNLYYSFVESRGRLEAAIQGEELVRYMENNNQTIGWEKNFYPEYSMELALIFSHEGKNRKAIEYCNKAVDAIETQKDIPEYYTSVYYGVITSLRVIKEDSLAFELCKRILPVYEKDIQNANYEDFFNLLKFAADHYRDKGDYISSCLYQEKALSFIKEKNDTLYGSILNDLATSYAELGRIEEAIMLAEESVSLGEKTNLSKYNIISYATRLLGLATCFSMSGSPKEAARYSKKCYTLLKDKLGLQNLHTMIAANTLACNYNELGYYEEAESILNMIVDEINKDSIKYRELSGSVYNNMALCRYGINQNLQECLYYLNKSYEIRREVYGEFDLKTIQSLYNKGRCLLDLGEISEGVKCINESLTQTKNIRGENNPDYINKSEILSIVYAKAGFYDRAILMEEERAEKLKKIVGDNNISFLRSLENLAEFYFYSNDTLKLFKTIIDESNGYKKMIISDFPNYTSVERTNIVNEMGRFYDNFFPLVCFYYKNESSLRSELYNALLFRKGILLNSEIEFSRLIRESGNSVLINNYNDLIAKKNLLNRQYQLPVEQRVFDVDSLRHAINEKEDYLVSVSKEYGDYTMRFRTNWKDIRDKLKDGELSVEFVEFYDTCAIQNRLYYALVINKYSDNPELVPLCMEQQIHEVMNNNTGGMYQLIWNPILQKSKNVNTLFFSPVGILNNIGIEYVNINEHENISDKYAIYRLSSTREIVENQKTDCKSAALYGGLDYSVDMDVLLAQNVRSGFEMNTSVIYRGLSDSLAVRNSFEPLYNTKTEISEIDKTLKKGNVVVSIYSDTFGTEESFKALSGKGMNLIHLATHGMYIDASEAESKKKETNLSFIQLDDHGGGQIQEDKSLSRSFLVMSGGDMLPSHKEVPDNLEDGILTASEISKLDLRGLDLVVLSACQTALGDVDNEGVYGLQRGFKKAGANTMLMSLDKVDDEATKILMVEFYKNLINGKSKQHSLIDAQRHLRQVDNGKYDKPEYWASFIMLDGLD